MKLLQYTIGALLAIGATDAAQPSCQRDSCLKQVKFGRKKGGPGACAAFFKVTVIPPAITTTSTITKTSTVATTVVESTKTDIGTTTTTSATSTTVTTTTTSTTLSSDSPPGLAKRATTTVTTSATSLPSYVSGFCSNTVQYSSACSCFGVKHQTTTLAPRTATTTLTESTTTASPVATSTSTMTNVVFTKVDTTTVETDTSTAIVVVTATPCSSPTSTPAVSLTNPTAILTSDFNHDDGSTTLSDLPFAVTFYGQSSNSISVGWNGYISIPDETDTYAFSNKPLPVYDSGVLSSRKLPNTALAIFWDDLFVAQGTAQGIYYQIDGDVGNRNLFIEWYMSQSSDTSAYFHFIMTLPESSSENVKYTYYDVSDFGNSATVGAQSQTANMFTQYSYNMRVITPGLQLEYNPANNVFMVNTMGCVSNGPS